MSDCGACQLGFSNNDRHRVCALEGLIDLLEVFELGEVRPKVGFRDIVRVATGKHFGVECMAL